MTMFPSLVDAVRRNAVNTNDGKLGWSRTQCELMAALQPYDLGGMFLPAWTNHPDLIDPQTWHDYRDEVWAEIGNGGLDLLGTSGWVIEFLWHVRGHIITIVIPTPDVFLADAIRRNDQVYCFAHYAGEWHLEQLNGQDTVAVALRMIRDAELNVEFVERDDSETTRVNRGRCLGSRPPLKNPRVISVSRLRKQYLGSGTSKPHQGGTHASPREHVRIITDRLITPKVGKPYRRNPQTIVVNQGVRRVTRIVK